MTRDLDADGGWPELQARLPGQVRSVAGIPLLLGGSPVGTLNVYRDEPYEWDRSDINGYLMRTRHLDAVTAFDVLRRRARDTRRRIADVATELLGGSTGPASDERVGDLDPSDLGLTGLAAPEVSPAV